MCVRNMNSLYEEEETFFYVKRNAVRNVVKI